VNKTPYHNTPNKEIFIEQYVKVYQQMLYWFIRKLVVQQQDADDILQNVFIKAWRGVENFRGECTIQTWLYRIATNETSTHFTKNKKRSFFSLDNQESDYSILVKASEGYDYKRLEWKLQLAIQQLPPRQKTVFCLRYFDEMPYKEMEEVLDTTESSLKASYHHAAVKVERFLIEK
jgi:RNA polymerase sigma factor (sigma-70 family)